MMMHLPTCKRAIWLQHLSVLTVVLMLVLVPLLLEYLTESNPIRRTTACSAPRVSWTNLLIARMWSSYSTEPVLVVTASGTLASSMNSKTLNARSKLQTARLYHPMATAHVRSWGMSYTHRPSTVISSVPQSSARSSPSALRKMAQLCTLSANRTENCCFRLRFVMELDTFVPTRNCSALIVFTVQTLRSQCPACVIADTFMLAQPLVCTRRNNANVHWRFGAVIAPGECMLVMMSSRACWMMVLSKDFTIHLPTYALLVISSVRTPAVSRQRCARLPLQLLPVLPPMLLERILRLIAQSWMKLQ